MTLPSIRNAMITSIRGYNRHLPMELLANMNLMALLRNCHPAEREDFTRQLERGGHLELDRDEHQSLFGRTSPFRKKI